MSKLRVRSSANLWAKDHCGSTLCKVLLQWDNLHGGFYCFAYIYYSAVLLFKNIYPHIIALKCILDPVTPPLLTFKLCLRFYWMTFINDV